MPPGANGRQLGRGSAEGQGEGHHDTSQERQPVRIEPELDGEPSAAAGAGRSSRLPPSAPVEPAQRSGWPVPRRLLARRIVPAVMAARRGVAADACHVEDRATEGGGASAVGRRKPTPTASSASEATRSCGRSAPTHPTSPPRPTGAPHRWHRAVGVGACAGGEQADSRGQLRAAVTKHAPVLDGPPPKFHLDLQTIELLAFLVPLDDTAAEDLWLLPRTSAGSVQRPTSSLQPCLPPQTSMSASHLS